MGHGVAPEEPSASGRWSATPSCREGRSGGLPRSCGTVSDGIKRAFVTGVKGKHAARKGGAPPVGLQGVSEHAVKVANWPRSCSESYSNDASLYICS